MGTRSMIAFDNGDEVYAIYCHWDGYLEYNGKVLLEHYNDLEKVEELMDLGNISSLGPDIGVKHPFSQFDTTLSTEEYGKLYRNMCCAYGRDRDEKDQEAKVFATLDEACKHYEWSAFYYMFDGLKWFYRESLDDNWKELTEEDVK